MVENINIKSNIIAKGIVPTIVWYLLLWRSLTFVNLKFPPTSGIENLAYN